MIIGFTGHRNKLCSEQSLLRIEERFPGAKWVHGGAGGFDTQVHEVALKLGKIVGDTLIVIRPDYKQYSHHVAPLIRNQQIVDMAERMVACYDGRKKGGTFFTVNYAHKVHKPVEYVKPVMKEANP